MNAIDTLKKMIDEKRALMVFHQNDKIEMGCKYIEFTLTYSKGGVNPFSYKTEKRGYRLHCTVKEKTEMGCSFYPQSDCNFRLFVGNEVKRDSNKAFNDALSDLKENWLNNPEFIARIEYAAKCCE